LRGIRIPRGAGLSSQISKLKGLLGEEEEGRRLFLVTAVVHILLPGIIILKTFPRVGRPYQKKKEKVSKIGFKRLRLHNRVCLKLKHPG
jgi:hypothetical protein